MISVSLLAGIIYKFTGTDSVNCYFLADEKIMIDTGNPDDREELKKELGRIVDLNKMEKVILTHLHYDHAGNVCLFPNAEILASREEIDAFAEDGFGAVFNNEVAKELKKRKVSALPEKLPGFEIIRTPGHTKGSICLVYKNMFVFTGDTKFGKGMYGRTDLPTSSPQEMQASLKRLSAFSGMVFAPGHDYCKE